MTDEIRKIYKDLFGYSKVDEIWGGVRKYYRFYTRYKRPGYCVIPHNNSPHLFLGTKKYGERGFEEPYIMKLESCSWRK